MAEVVGEFTPPTTWWTVDKDLTLSPGNWQTGTVKYWSLDDATSWTVDNTRANDTRMRIMRHDDDVLTEVGIFEQPDTWWHVETFEDDTWSVYTVDNVTKYWSEAAATEVAGPLARTLVVPTRVVVYPPE